MLRKALASLVLLLMAAPVARAQVRGNANPPPTMTVRGRVILESTAVQAEGIQVNLERGEMQTVATTYSDGIGNFEFRNLPIANYFVFVRTQGYEEARYPVQNGGGTMTIFLAREPFRVVDVHRESSVVDVTELNRNFPKKALEDYEAGREDLRKGNAVKAAERLEAAIALAPDFYSAHNTLGIAYQKLQRYRDGEKEFNRARELNPRSVDPLVNLGSLYIQEAEDNTVTKTRRLRGRILDQALDILEAAVKLNPRSGPAYYLLGAANYKSSFYEEAEAALKRAFELDRRMSEVRLMLANVYMRLKNWDAAIEQLDAYLAENPQAADRGKVQEALTRIHQNVETPQP